ncbi:pyridoxamine 5'-phosphate oxidase family protein [Paracoccus sp. 1_MG-2023]|uniref:pyridoxamine 5'-phosphate oxidase family protein n=1 Tax=unclassified Paracoccus (in: a-proteobacteria) TaxID=2688777 RepID=UPI001C0A18FC|nr:MULTISPECIES: pyridoxamine 5'-phosphate oxidase family protein [unclassified Paracoccus (in: a-proteobacteria)]MBU2959076.1 pyridoxamine 5'-phosphate oxidase family protein [Paracoccus sp. C2R09]MDO6669049.1 pyridoxamine 5'-phosphate oxidase family protein [Paracoccus sp. 1_MG-2023]
MTEQHDNADKFWKRLDDVRSGMLGTTGEARLIPMSHYADREQRVLWFITARDTELAKDLATGSKPGVHVVSDGGEGIYTRCHGRLSLTDDRAKLEELMGGVASAWFDKGEKDPDAQLVRMDLTEAEVWTTEGSLAFMYHIAKAKVTGETPNVGKHFALTF